MPSGPSPKSPSRRDFITTAGTVAALGATMNGLPNLGNAATAAAAPANPDPQATPAPKRKIPIGVFDPVFDKMDIDPMIELISGWGIEAVEIGTGGYPQNRHCPLDDLVQDASKAKAWKKKFESKNIRVGALSCHGNPVHPDAKIAERDAETFRKTVLLAERLEVPVIVGFSGCPAGAPGDTMPNWATYRWPPEYDQILKWQWSERVIPYWKDATKYAREHGVHKLAFEMHPGFVVYNPMTLMKLREAVGEEIGANCDLSHLFWQGCDPVEVIHFLAKNNMLFHAHMKDTVFFKDNVAKYGVLNFAFETKELPQASETFRAVGYGHSAGTWKEIVKAYMDVGYQGILSIENEDPILPGEVGVQRALYVLKNVREELLNAPS